MFDWREIYIGHSMGEYVRVKNLMEANGISTKIKVRSSRERLAG